MNVNIKSKEKMSKLDSLFKIENIEEKIELKASIIQLDILYEVGELMKKNRDVSNKTELAKRLGKSKGFVSQLFSGDKTLNLKMIAQLEDIFDVKFVSSFKDNSSFEAKKITKDDYTNNKDYSKDSALIFSFPNGEKLTEILAA